jgi:cytochrome c-type biogenesis protein CcmH/NrfG
MKRNDEFAGQTNRPSEADELDPKLREALGHFKASVDAWSDEMMSRPRTVHETAVRRTWRLAAGWALGCVLVGGAVSTGVYERHQKQELARIAAVREAEHQRQLAADRAKEEEDLLAKVDSDLSRDVPSAMEPLASLMTDYEAQ